VQPLGFNMDLDFKFCEAATSCGPAPSMVFLRFIAICLAAETIWANAASSAAAAHAKRDLQTSRSLA
jgi:hypothetical protein